MTVGGLVIRKPTNPVLRVLMNACCCIEQHVSVEIFFAFSLIMRRLLILLRFEWVDLKLSFKNKNSIYLTKVDRLADDVHYKIKNETE
jgi:hypothetical protein